MTSKITYSDIFLKERLLLAKSEHQVRKIGEGNFGYVLGKFDEPLCFKVGKQPLNVNEYEVLSFLFRLNLPVPEPFAFIDNAIAMRLIDGFNLEEAQK